MIQKFTKGQIDRLGETIRFEGLQLSDNILIDLQQYRISHEEPLSKIFTILCNLSKAIHHSSISTFRIKRFESILSKLDRYADMRFSRMWDIAGCRCIVRNETDVYKLKKLIESHKDIHVVKVNDYIEEPQDSGYRSVHLYLKQTCSDTLIEVQLRTLPNHDWSTLVEITDLLFETRLKEFGDNKELFKLHKLLSNHSILTSKDKKEIFEIIKKYEFFDKLSEVFARNYLRVRKQWLLMESKNQKYFLIETRKDDVPKIVSFSNFLQAEEEYFNIYKNAENANVVLTYLQNHNYNLIATAYANYILTFHSFMNDCLLLFESLLSELLIKKQFVQFAKLYSFWNELAFTHSENLVSEIDEAIGNSDIQTNKKGINKIRKKHGEWLKDINTQVQNSNKSRQRLNSVLNKNLPKTNPAKFISNLIIKRIDKTTRNKMKKIFENSKAFREYQKA